MYITDDTYTKKQVLRMEHLILKVLAFDLSVPTILSFITSFSASTELPETTMFLAMVRMNHLKSLNTFTALKKLVDVHLCQQKSIGLRFSMSQTGSDVRYSCHHNSSRFTFPIFAHSCRFSVLHSLQSITPRIY